MEHKDKELAKVRIEALVKQYCQMFSAEFEQFKKAQRIKISLQKDKFADMSKKSDMLVRQLCEMPETLFIIFKLRLSEEELQWFNTIEGKTWFVKRFTAFRVSEKV